MKRRLTRHRPGRAVFLYAMSLTLAGPAYGQFWPSSYERSAAALSADSVEQRRDAARDLAQMPSSVARQLLPRALGDADPEVRLLAGAVAIEHRYEPAAPTVIQWLSDADPRLRAMAAQMLASLGPSDQAIAPLARLLSDPSPMARRHAARALARAQSVDAARVLLNHLDDANEVFQLEVIDALATLGDEVAVLPLVAKIQDSRASVRRAAIRALSSLQGMERGTAALVLALTDSDPQVRVAAIHALGDMKAESAVDALEEVLLRDREITVRVAALQALVSSASQRGLRLAVHMLDHPRQELRDEALITLSGAAGSVAPVLSQCINEEPSATKLKGCALALGRSRAAGAASVISAAYREGRLAPQAALEALAATQDPVALPVALELLSSDAMPIRHAALRALWDVLNASQPDGRAVEPLVEALRRAASSEEAVLLLPLLGKTGSTRAVPHLTPYLAPEVPLDLRVAATRGLGWIKGANVSPSHLIAGLTAQHSVLRWETVMAVRQGEWRGIASTLVRLIERSSAGEAEALATALWGPAGAVTEAAIAQRLRALIERALGPEQDALLEAYSRLPWELSEGAFSAWSRDSESADNAKVAEVLAQQPKARALLTSMLRDDRKEVLANAVWSLGRQSAVAAVSQVKQLTLHPDVSVAANAVASFARLSRDARDSTHLCELLEADRAPVIANALAGLHSLRTRCNDGELERRLLATHPSRFVREGAATLLSEIASSQPDEDARTLRQCARQDIDGRVASRCVTNAAPTEPPATPAVVGGAITILVVPVTSTEPKPRIAFALKAEDGFIRFGWADRRGAIYEAGIEASDARLVLPAGMW